MIVWVEVDVVDLPCEVNVEYADLAAASRVHGTNMAIYLVASSCGRTSYRSSRWSHLVGR